MTTSASPARSAPPVRQAGRGRRSERREARRARRQAREEQLGAVLAATEAGVRVGAISLRSATGYLMVWTVVLFFLLLLVLCGGYAALWELGVVASLSRSLAVILSEPLPDSGILPLLAPHAVLPVAALASALLAVLWLVSALALVLVHNAVSALTGGLRVRFH